MIFSEPNLQFIAHRIGLAELLHQNRRIQSYRLDGQYYDPAMWRRFSKTSLEIRSLMTVY